MGLLRPPVEEQKILDGRSQVRVAGAPLVQE
jgi:hypothetical protein